MAPVLTPAPSSSSSLTSLSPSSSILSRPALSTSSSAKSIADLILTASIAAPDELIEVAKVEGVRHANLRLDARNHKKPTFNLDLLQVVCKLHVPGWSMDRVKPEQVMIRKVSGAMTNAVFFVSCPSIPSLRTVLLRIYGPSSGSLISRPRELHILHALSSRYKIGPRVYGTFENGRVEEYFDSIALTPDDIRHPEISRWIGARMAELHSVDIRTVEGPDWDHQQPKHDVDDDTHGWQIVRNVKSWLGPAQDVLKLPSVSATTRNELDLVRFKKEWNSYLAWVLRQRDGFGKRRVFAHNDTQYGNLLRLRDSATPSVGVDEHRQIIVVDFEYAAPNPAAYDIANHFHEWTGNYHCPTPHLLDPTKYPTLTQRQNFYTSYIQHASMLADDPTTDEAQLSEWCRELEQDVRIWSPSSHAGWAIWGIVQARDDLEGGVPVENQDFDYIGYAKGRMAAFRQDLQRLGIQDRH